MNKPKPWTVPGSPWKSEASFWSWVRGVLRKGWSKHPVKHLYMQGQRRREKNTNPKSMTRFPEVWVVDCEICRKACKTGEVEVDHKTMAGSFTTLDEIKDFAERLFLIDFDSIRVLCKPCHKIVSHAQNEGISFEEAEVQKRVIEFMKRPKSEIVDFCVGQGYNSASLTNAEKRRKAVESIFKEGVQVGSSSR